MSVPAARDGERSPDKRYYSLTRHFGSVRMTIIVCSDCGVEVINQDKHDRHHAQLDRTATMAAESYSTSAMFGPIK
jgi:hypothetical protein